MNKKKLFTSLLCFSMLALAACSGGNKEPEGQTSTSGETSEPAHVHTFSDAWSKDNNEHWHSATCGHNVEKDRAAHTMNDLGYCSVCGLDMMESVSITLNTETGERMYKTDYMDLGANEVLRYRISGGSTGHGIELEDYDPINLPNAVTAYTIVDGVKTPAVLDGKTALNLGSEGKLYLILDASELSYREDVWFKLLETHIPTVNPLPTSKTFLGFCSVCDAYLGHQANLKANIGPTIKKGGYAYYRVELTSGEDTHYGIFADFNEVDDNEAKAEYFVLRNNAPYKLGEAKSYENNLIDVTLGSDDNYLYLVYSYVGDAESLTLETSYVTNLDPQACDDNRYYYGQINNELIDHTIFIPGSRINAFLYIAFVPSLFGDFYYEISVSGCDGFSVWQDKGSKVEVINPDGGRYYPVTGNEMIIKIEPETIADDGGGTCVTVTEISY